MGFKQHSYKPAREDQLIIYEAKAKLSEYSKDNVLQAAIIDSSKDEIRLAESLNAMKQRLFDKRDENGVNVLTRFQKIVDFPYKRTYGAAAVITNSSFCSTTLSESDASDHVSSGDLELIVICGEQLMQLVHTLYESAANEA